MSTFPPFTVRAFGPNESAAHARKCMKQALAIPDPCLAERALQIVADHLSLQAIRTTDDVRGCIFFNIDGFDQFLMRMPTVVMDAVDSGALTLKHTFECT